MTLERAKVLSGEVIVASASCHAVRLKLWNPHARQNHRGADNAANLPDASRACSEF